MRFKWVNFLEIFKRLTSGKKNEKWIKKGVDLNHFGISFSFD